MNRATCLAEDKDVRVRRAVAAAVGELPVASSGATVIKLLATDDRGTRLGAVQSAGKLRLAAAVPQLMQLVRQIGDEATASEILHEDFNPATKF